MATFAISRLRAAESQDLYPALKSYLMERAAEFNQIPAERKTQIKKVATYIQVQRKADKPVRLIFICTHNSRRSHMSQIWASTAAQFYGIEQVETFSGGTEATAFNSRAIDAMERAGLKIDKIDDGKNPHYSVKFNDSTKPLECFSKKYSESPNPKTNFCAVMTCSQADASCPVIEGASLRVAISYEDPKLSDGKPEEFKSYDERCRQISREMLYLFSQVGNKAMGRDKR